MQLLGTYQSNLTAFHYQQLLQLLQSAIQQGDLASGPAYDQTTLKKLEQQATNFANLPTAVAGSRVLDEGINYPLQLLLALYNSLSGETKDFITRSQNLVGIAKQETDLIDQILAADGTAQWERGTIRIPNPWSFVWNFTDGVGKESSYVTPTDPSNSSLLGTLPVSRYILDTASNTILEGLVPTRTESNIGIQSMNWSYSADTAEELLADDLNWTELTFQETLPAVNYTAPSLVSVYLPLNKTDVSLISVTGSNPGGALPTYLRLLFHPRRMQISATISNGVITNLSQYTIDPEAVLIFTLNADGTVGTIYDSSLYIIDQTGNITPTGIGTNVAVQIRFSENFPAYQCSLDLTNWSPVVMLDPERLYPDDAISYAPIALQGAQFPVTDESGASSGLYFNLTRKLDTDYIFLIRNPGAANYGKTAVLQLDVKGTSYLNEVSLSPFSAFPATLTQIELEGLTPNTRDTVWQGSLYLDRIASLRFPRQLVTKIYLTIVQENYTIVESTPVDPTSLRRQTMNTLQSCLPFNVRRTAGPVLNSQRVYEYQVGFEDLEVLDTSISVPSICSQDAGVIPGRPDILTFDASLEGTTEFWLSFIAYSSSGAVLDTKTNVLRLYPGSTYLFPFSSTVVLTQVATVAVSITTVLRDSQSSVSQYLLQAALA